jgi:hypothetical protein
VKKSNWSKTLNIIQNTDDTAAVKAMYNQFERKTILIELKIRKGRRNNNNNPVLNDEDVLMDLVPFFSLSNSLNHLNRSASYQLLLEMKEKDMLQVKFLL